MRFLRIDPLAFKRLSPHVTYGMNISITTEQILNGYVKANEKKATKKKEATQQPTERLRRAKNQMCHISDSVIKSIEEFTF